MNKLIGKTYIIHTRVFVPNFCYFTTKNIYDLNTCKKVAFYRITSKLAVFAYFLVKNVFFFCKIPIFLNISTYSGVSFLFQSFFDILEVWFSTFIIDWQRTFRYTPTIRWKSVLNLVKLSCGTKLKNGMLFVMKIITATIWNINKDFWLHIAYSVHILYYTLASPYLNNVRVTIGILFAF